MRSTLATLLLLLALAFARTSEEKEAMHKAIRMKTSCVPHRYRKPEHTSSCALARAVHCAHSLHVGSQATAEGDL